MTSQIQIIRNKFAAHSDLKEHLLEAIDNTFAQSHEAAGSKISNTDYFKAPEPTLYSDLFFRNFVPELTDLARKLGSNEWAVDDIWFQQYLKDDTHHWHTHAKCHFTNVYFLELPDTSLTTEVYDPFDQRILELECNEGDVITFPAWVPHRSAPNPSDQRKTIISFNTSLHITNDNYIIFRDEIEEL